jgi:hypothetical protein
VVHFSLVLLFTFSPVSPWVLFVRFRHCLSRAFFFLFFFFELLLPRVRIWNMHFVLEPLGQPIAQKSIAKREAKTTSHYSLSLHCSPVRCDHNWHRARQMPPSINHRRDTPYSDNIVARADLERYTVLKSQAVQDSCLRVPENNSAEKKPIVSVACSLVYQLNAKPPTQ